MTGGWEWKYQDGETAALLYEPGNWGDILKDAWVVEIAQWLLALAGRKNFSYLDPFAGAPVYPLGKNTAKRMLPLARTPLGKYCAKFLAGNLWPCAATLIAEIAGTGSAERIQVFDLDPLRRIRLETSPAFSVADAISGWEVLRKFTPGKNDLILIDPYDFLAEWREQLPTVLAACESTSVLLYIYNRSGKGKERLRDYRDFRNALDDARGNRPKLIARAASDAFLPSAHHEVIFLPHESAAAYRKFPALLTQLETTALAINDLISRAAIVER